MEEGNDRTLLDDWHHQRGAGQRLQAEPHVGVKRHDEHHQRGAGLRLQAELHVGTRRRLHGPGLGIVHREDLEGNHHEQFVSRIQVPALVRFPYGNWLE